MLLRQAESAMPLFQSAMFMPNWSDSGSSHAAYYNAGFNPNYDFQLEPQAPGQMVLPQNANMMFEANHNFSTQFDDMNERNLMSGSQNNDLAFLSYLMENDHTNTTSFSERNTRSAPMYDSFSTPVQPMELSEYAPRAYDFHSITPDSISAAMQNWSGFLDSSIGKEPKSFQVDASKQPKAPRQIKCLNCETTQTPVWRRDESRNGLLCNACGLHYRLYGTHRSKTRKPRAFRRRSTKSSGSPQAADSVQHFDEFVDERVKFGNPDVANLENVDNHINVVNTNENV